MHQADNKRMPAEWEPSGAIMISWPHKDTDWAYMLDEVTECFINIAEAVSQDEMLIVVAPDIKLPESKLSHIDPRKIIYFQTKTNDTWARDFGPITVFEGDEIYMCDFKFNGWGLKFPACYDNLVTSTAFGSGVLIGNYENHLGFVLEGGSIESDGKGTIMTTAECLLSPNRNGDLNVSKIEDYLKQVLGAHNVLWIKHGSLMGDDTDSHVDTLARFAPNDIILYVKCDDIKDPHYDSLAEMEKDLRSFRTPAGRPYNLVGLPMPSAIYDENGERLPATYANFLITPKSVLVPSYGQPDNDRFASQIIQFAFPDREIKQIDCRALIKQHGSLHCVTMQLPKEILPI